MTETPRGILIVDLGTQYAQLIARRDLALRSSNNDLRVRSGRHVGAAIDGHEGVQRSTVGLIRPKSSGAALVLHFGHESLSVPRRVQGGKERC